MAYLYRLPAVILMLAVFYFTLAYSGQSVDTQEQNKNYYQLKTKKTFTEVVDDAIFAITEHNFRLTNHLRIGQAIRDRGNENFPDYDVLLYCNIMYAEQMLELQSNIINSCPNRVAISQHDDSVLITVPLWTTTPQNMELWSLSNKINEIAREIVNYAAEDWQIIYDTTASPPN